MKKIFKISISLAVIAILLLQFSGPIFVYAQTTIANPLKVDSIQCLISEVLSFVVDLLAIAAVLYIMWAGFLFVKAQGKPDKLTEAKTALLHALIGTAIILGAWTLATVIANTISKITQTDISLNSQNCTPSQ